MQFKVNDKSFDGVCLLDAEGNPITKTNPLATVATKGSNATMLALEDEQVFTANGVLLIASGVGVFNQFQIWNPANSGKLVVIYNIAMWQVGSVTIQAIESSAAISSSEANRVFKNSVIGSTKTASTKIFTATTSSLPTEAPNWEALVNMQNQPGASIVPSSVQFVLKPGRGITVTQRTANIVLNANIVIGEVDIA